MENKTILGLSFIEFAMILVLIALVSTMAVPQLLTHQPVVLEGEMYPTTMESEHAVRVALSLAEADLKRAPDVSSLALYVQAERVEAMTDGVQVIWGRQSYKVMTYSDVNCVTRTRSTDEQVLCVGDAM